MSIDFSAYGNAPEGEHFAVLRTTSGEKFPDGMRYVVGFVIVNPEIKRPIEDADGHPLFAVAVCNLVKKGNAKSKQFKIRKALLREDEFDPIGNATSVPDWDHFKERLPDGSWNIVKVRVATRGEHGKNVSVVTHIQRPRDGVWESIEGKFEGNSEGPPFPWINLDGTRKALRAEEQAKLPGDQQLMYEVWNEAPASGKPWFSDDGQFRELSPETMATLHELDRAKYQIATIKHQLGSRRPHAA
jgi:hypothetical protein